MSSVFLVIYTKPVGWKEMDVELIGYYSESRLRGKQDLILESLQPYFSGPNSMGSITEAWARLARSLLIYFAPSIEVQREYVIDLSVATRKSSGPQALRF